MKIVIYTSLTGNYDKLKQPVVVDPNFTYICFSNDFEEKKIGIWEIRKIPYESNDLQRLSRYPKMHPHVLLKDFDYSVYIDANIQIKGPALYKGVKKVINENVSLAGMPHLEIDCAYEEGLRAIISRRERDIICVFKELKFLRKSRFPFHWGMYEANVIFRNHHNIDVISQCELWWFCVLNYSRRDQISYTYTLWKNKIPFNYLLSPKYNVHNHDDFDLISHQVESSWRKKTLKKMFFKPVMFLLKIIISIGYDK
jgi:hypothetical protein